MIFFIGATIFLFLGGWLSVLFFNKGTKDKVSSIIIAVGCLCLFVGITNLIIIRYIPPIEIKETTYGLVEYSDGSYLKNIGGDSYIKFNTDENTEKDLMLYENSIVIEDDENPPFVIIKENVYPDYFKLLFMEKSYPKTYEIHI